MRDSRVVGKIYSHTRSSLVKQDYKTTRRQDDKTIRRHKKKPIFDKTVQMGYHCLELIPNIYKIKHIVLSSIRINENENENENKYE